MPEKLKQLLAWFDAYQITFNEITLSECEQIFDLTTYIDVYTRSVKRNWDNPTFATDIKATEEAIRGKREVSVGVNLHSYYLSVSIYSNRDLYICLDGLL